MPRVSTYPPGALPATIYGIVGGASRRLTIGTLAAQAANGVAITGGTIEGVSRVVVGGTFRAPISSSANVNTLASLTYEIGGGGTALLSSDGLPLNQDSGITQAYGRAVISPSRWGPGSDAHGSLYLGGSQINAGAVANSIEFANWAYFTSTGTGAAGLQNFAARQNAVKFAFVMRNLGGEYTHQLSLRARNAAGSFVSPLSVQSSGLVGVLTESPTEALDIAANTLRLRTARTPASATAAGTQGSFCWDATYFYVCTGTNVWRRVAHAGW